MAASVAAVPDEEVAVTSVETPGEVPNSEDMFLTGKLRRGRRLKWIKKL